MMRAVSIVSSPNIEHRLLSNTFLAVDQESQKVESIDGAPACIQIPEKIRENMRLIRLSGMNFDSALSFRAHLVRCMYKAVL